MVDPLFKANEDSSIAIKGGSYISSRAEVRPAHRSNAQTDRTTYGFINSGIRLVRVPK